MTTYNKIEIDGTTYIDLSQDTVASAADIAEGKVGHLNSGEQVTGSMTKNLSGTFTVPAQTQSITFDVGGVRRYLLLMPSDMTLRKGLGYKACSFVFVDFVTNDTFYITTNNSGTDTMGYWGKLNYAVDKVDRSGTVITMSSNATTGRTFGYFVDMEYKWVVFDEH